MAEIDGNELNEQKGQEIRQAQAYFEKFAGIPAIRKFAKYIYENPKNSFKLGMSDPMKLITQYGNMAK
ncbi:MAG: hypothetical protein R8K48_04150 [Gallionella sp.]